MKRTLIALTALLVLTSACGRKSGTGLSREETPAKPVSPEEITDTLYIDFLAHYKAADNRFRMESQSLTGKASPQEIQNAHLAKLRKEMSALEKKFGVTRSALDLYMEGKKKEQPGYWMKNIYPKLEARTAELEKTSADR